MQPCALLSVSDKRGIDRLGAALADAGYRLLSTGGTARALRDAGLAVTEVSEHTGAAEMMDGRVKTLHPTVHGGILGRRGEDDTIMAERGIAPIDIVVVNLYPFSATVARPDVEFGDAIEHIDIGGPAMVRAAAKNFAAVAVVTDPDDYERVTDALHDHETLAALRYDLAVKAFEHTARYDAAVAEWLGRRLAPGAEPAVFPRTLNRQFTLVQALRYGENPHQRAAFYRDADPAADTIAGARLLQGKAMSYNNVMDADAALDCVRRFESPACVIVKHANPCGVAEADCIGAAYDLAWRTDETSAFGGIIAFNRPLDAGTATSILERQFVEVILATGIEPEAHAALTASPNVRVLDLADPAGHPSPALTWRHVSGGLLVQDEDTIVVTREDCRIATRREPTDAEWRDLLFAWRVARSVKSNAIVYARDRATVGVGAGQMSRVYSARIAGIKAADAGLEVRGAAMASDAFLPFRDGIDAAAEAGIASVIQPGGSKRDGEVIAAADEHGMAMVFTSVRHFRH